MSTGSSSGAGSCLVVGYDRTDSARLAADWAARELSPAGKLVIVHASRPLHAPPSPLSSVQERMQLGQALIDELLLEADEPLLDVEVEAVISDRDPVNALIDAASRHGARAIVVGSERHSPLHKALGTVTSGLMQRSPVPIMVVPVSAAHELTS
jgi:nucleotide-binding universal stress UspA family protein